MIRKRSATALVPGLLLAFGCFGGCASADVDGQTDDNYCYECAPCDCLSPGYSSCEEEFGDQECWLNAAGGGGGGAGGVGTGGLGAGGFGGTPP